MVLSGTLILNSGFDKYYKLSSLYMLYGLFSMIFACVSFACCYCMCVICMHVIACVSFACMFLHVCYLHTCY